MKIKTHKIMSLMLQLIVLAHYFKQVLSLSLSQQLEDNLKAPSPQSGSRHKRQILPTSAILLPNVGQYLSLIQILVLKLVIWTQIMRLLGQDYVGKGIKSAVPLSEQEDLDEILDYDDLEAEIDLAERKRRRKRTIHTTPITTNTTNTTEETKVKESIKILVKFREFVKLKTQYNSGINRNDSKNNLFKEKRKL